jgi:hypothetical protein
MGLGLLGSGFIAYSANRPPIARSRAQDAPRDRFNLKLARPIALARSSQDVAPGLLSAPSRFTRNDIEFSSRAPGPAGG